MGAFIITMKFARKHLIQSMVQADDVPKGGSIILKFKKYVITTRKEHMRNGSKYVVKVQWEGKSRKR